MFTGTKQDIFSVISVYWFYWILCLFYFHLQHGPGHKHVLPKVLQVDMHKSSLQLFYHSPEPKFLMALFLLPFDPTGLHGPHWPDELHGLHWPHCAAGLASVVWKLRHISVAKVRIKIIHFIFRWCFLFEISQRSDNNVDLQRLKYCNWCR